MTTDSEGPPADRAPKRVRRLVGRKLLVASIGVATVRYALSCIGADGLLTTSANLLAPPPRLDAGVARPRDAGPPAPPDAASAPQAGLDAGDGDEDAGEGDGGEPDGP